MLLDYVNEALERAKYEIIEDEEPFYGEVLELRGVWATGTSLEECRRNLQVAVEDWLLFSVAKGFSVPQLGNATMFCPQHQSLSQPNASPCSRFPSRVH